MYVRVSPLPLREPGGLGQLGSTCCGADIQRSGLTKQLQLLPLAVLSLVCDILMLNYCTKLFHQTVHALSTQWCKTRRNIGVSRSKHNSNQTAFSIAFFAAFSAFFPQLFAFFANPSDRISPPPPALWSREGQIYVHRWRMDSFMCIHVHGGNL